MKKKFQPLCDYISTALDRKCELVYKHTVKEIEEALVNNQAALAYAGPSPVINAMNRNSNVEPIAILEVNGKAMERSYFVARKESDINSLHDLNDKTLAFGAKETTFAYYVPQYMLLKAEISRNSLRGFYYAGNLKNVTKDVMEGKADAGTLVEKMAMMLIHKKKLPLKTFAVSMPYPSHQIVANNSFFTKKEIKRLKRKLVFLKKDHPASKAIGKWVTGFKMAFAHQYDELREVNRIVKESFK